MTITTKQKEILHVAKTKLRLSEEDYRRLLAQVGGVTRSAELDAAGFSALLGFMEHLGFRPLAPSGPDYGQRPGMASFAQLELIRARWSEWSGARPEDGLEIWLKGTFKVDSLRFVTADQARRIITAQGDEGAQGSRGLTWHGERMEGGAGHGSRRPSAVRGPDRERAP